MINTKSKLALALGIVSAIALSAASAEARTKRSAPKATQSTVTGNPFAYQPSPYPQYPQSYRGSYNLYDGGGYSGGGINFRDGRNGANYNPNQ